MIYSGYFMILWFVKLLLEFCDINYRHEIVRIWIWVVRYLIDPRSTMLKLAQRDISPYLENWINIFSISSFGMEKLQKHDLCTLISLSKIIIELKLSNCIWCTWIHAFSLRIRTENAISNWHESHRSLSLYKQLD